MNGDESLISGLTIQLLLIHHAKCHGELITVAFIITHNALLINLILVGDVTKDNADAVSLDESISTSSIGTGSSTMKRKSLSKTSSKIFVVGNDGSYSSTT